MRSSNRRQRCLAVRAFACAGLLAASACAGVPVAGEAASPGVAAEPPLFPICVRMRFGFIDRTGKVVVPPTLGMIDETIGVLTKVWVPDPSPPGEENKAPRTGRAGFIDTRGRFAVEPIYEDAHPFSEGLAAVKREGKWGFVDAGGASGSRSGSSRRTPSPRGSPSWETRRGSASSTPLAGPSSTWRESGGGGGAASCRSRPMDPSSTGLPPSASSSAARSRTSSSASWTGREGSPSSRPSPTPTGSTAASRAHERGQEVISPRYEHSCLWFRERLCQTMVADRWAYVDRSGAEVLVLPPDTTYADEFSEGIARVEAGPATRYVLRDGRPAFKGTFKDGRRFQGGLASVQFLNGGSGYVDREGRVVYRQAEPCYP